MLLLNNVTYVMNDFCWQSLLICALGCDNGEQYACCGESYFVTDPEKPLEQDREYLYLYGYKIPEKSIIYHNPHHNFHKAVQKDRNFVLVCMRRSDMLAYAKFIELNQLNPKQCYVMLVSAFTEEEIAEGDSLMPFSEVMDEYYTDLMDKGFKPDKKDTINQNDGHWKDLVWLQDCLKMSNVQMSMHFGVKLRTIENWRAKRGSMPDYAWYYLIQNCFVTGAYLKERYGSDVEEVLSNI